MAQTHSLQMEFVEDVQKDVLGNRETGPSNKATHGAYLEIAGFALHGANLFDGAARSGLAAESQVRFPWAGYAAMQRHYFLARACEAKAETFSAQQRRIGEGCGEAASWYLVAHKEVQAAQRVVAQCNAAHAAKACDMTLDRAVIDRTLQRLADDISRLAASQRTDAEQTYSQAVMLDWGSTRLREVDPRGPVDQQTGKHGPHVAEVVRALGEGRGGGVGRPTGPHDGSLSPSFPTLTPALLAPLSSLLSYPRARALPVNGRVAGGVGLCAPGCRARAR
jgi:hypothetical protein